MHWQNGDLSPWRFIWTFSGGLDTGSVCMNSRGSTFKIFQNMNFLAPFMIDSRHYCGKDLISLKGGLESDPGTEMQFRSMIRHPDFLESMVLPLVSFLFEKSG
jgi:hypothetical protein